MIDKSTNKIGAQLFPGSSILYHLIKRSSFKCLRIILNAMEKIPNNNKYLLDIITYVYDGNIKSRQWNY